MSADDRLGTAERERLASGLAVRSGRLALEYFHRTHACSARDGSSVIDAGRVVLERLVTEIGRAFPDDAILVEQGRLTAGPQHPLYCWILAPVDGADDFARGMPGFSVSIGVLRNGMPFAGAVYDPITRWLFTAGTGRGAWLNDRPLRSSPASLSPDSLIAVRTPSGEGAPPFVEDWLCRHRLRRFGSTALHLCYAAMGGLDLVYDHRASLWDLAGAAPVLLEAGGVLTLADGAPLFPVITPCRDSPPMTVLAGNPISHAHALSDVAASAVTR
jgi:myo-inositol-1(or 4)-monophosphatase